MSTSQVTDAVARVEAELAAFWSSPDTSTGDEKTKVRAATLNFVAVAAASEMERLREQTDALADTHAGRAFLLQMDGRLAPWDVETDVHAECRIDGSVPICYDRVELSFGAMAAGRAASIVRSLALPEVPVVAEAGLGAPAPLVDSLVLISDRLVVDSAHTSIGRIAELIRKSAAPVADRAFVRTFSWRELTARFFDEAPEGLSSIRRVEIGRTPGGKQEPAALFVGWMASRLGWSFVSRAAAKDGRDRPIEIVLVEDARKDVEPGVLTSVRIAAEPEGERLDLECVRSEAPGIVRWTMEGTRRAAHDHPLGFHDETWVLVKAIDATAGDRMFREAALAAFEWSAL